MGSEMILNYFRQTKTKINLNNMKQILKSSMVLLVFSAAMLIFQMSCKKDAQATTSTSTTTQLNKIIYTRRFAGSYAEMWTANYDGTNQAKINIAMPTGFVVGDNARLSPDGQTIIFEGYDSTNYITHIYSCNVNGSNVHKIIDGSTTSGGLLLNGAY
jgi:hypothetical protein